jgi:hypothetical protein
MTIAASIPASTPADGAELIGRWWCRRETDATRIAATARAALRRCESKAGTPPARADARSVELDSRQFAFVCAAVTDAARRRGVALFSDDDIAAHAAEIAARIDTELQKLKESGGMKSVNRAYKAYRLESSRHGERVLRYDEWMRQYRANLVRQAAAALREF